MTQHSDRHLTTEQLSALLDQQLSDEERAISEAHLHSCPQCRSALAELRLTVALLHALPQPELPRSFTLPTNVTYLQEHPRQQDVPIDTPSRPSLPAIQQRRPTPLRRPARILSALVAVIGLFFLLPSLAAALPHLGGRENTSTTSSASIPAAASHQTPQVMGPHTATATPKRTAGGTGTFGTMTPNGKPKAPTPSASSASTSSSKRAANTSGNQPPSLPLPNLSTPLGQQEVGLTLLVLGILGLIVTRRRQKRA